MKHPARRRLVLDMTGFTHERGDVGAMHPDIEAATKIICDDDMKPGSMIMVLRRDMGELEIGIIENKGRVKEKVEQGRA